MWNFIQPIPENRSCEARKVPQCITRGTSSKCHDTTFPNDPLLARGATLIRMKVAERLGTGDRTVVTGARECLWVMRIHIGIL